jgi:hypothetical protein
MGPLKLLIAISTLLMLSGCAIYHHYGPYYGKVVDTEMKAPLEGAAVLAVYYTELYTVAGTVGKYLEARETVTDKNGEFRIPSNNIFTLRPLNLFDNNVWFWIFKPEYGCYPNHSKVRPMYLPNGTIPPDSHVIIELPRLNSKDERIENQRCEPVSIPMAHYKVFLQLINTERLSLGLEPVPIM